MIINTLAKLGWILAAFLVVIVVVQAQQTTERYIPVGYSPGISGDYSYQGTIASTSAEDRTLTVQDAKGMYTFKVVPATRIWLDQTKAEKSTLVGSFEDCQAGRRVEIMYQHEDKSVADWVKIEVP